MDETTRVIHTELYSGIETVTVRRGECALIVTDMQHMCASRDFGMYSKAKLRGQEDLFDYYFECLEHSVVKNIARLLAAFRVTETPVFFTKIESLTTNGRERSTSHKLLGVHNHPGSKEAQILRELAPLENEIVLSKTASGAFASSNLDYLLRNMGIQQIVATGVFTNECVENLVRSGADLGYEVIVVSDACAALTRQLHEASLFVLGHSYASIWETDDVITQLRDNGTMKIVASSS